ncbi:MAG: HemY protein [Tepidiphilus sp.]|jgi:HemY protein|nr:HemY protein [Tepidiphilus sp.]
MKALITLVLVAALAVAAGLALQSVDGYVVFVVPPWRAQLSLTLFALLLVLVVIALYLSLRLGVMLFGLPRTLRRRRDAWRLRRAVRTLVRLVRAHVLGDAATVQRLAQRLDRSPGVAEAGAALAAATALERGDEARAENWLARLERWPDVRTVLEAEFGVRFSRPERLQAAMERLEKMPALPEATALRLRLEAAQREEKWQEVLASARRLRALESMDAAKAAALIRQAHLNEASSRLALGADLFAWWKRLPKEERFDPEFLAALARLAIERAQGGKVRPILEAALDKRWLPELVRRYPACLDAAERQAALARLESWLQAHPEEPAVLEALVELCLELKLWGKARDYLARLRRLGADPKVLERFAARLQSAEAGRGGAILPAP